MSREAWGIALLAASVVYCALSIDRGWIPHDDGMLGQSAVRVLAGELPHRDFQDMYTGGLSYLHALSFALFGINLLAPRLLLFASFCGFSVVAYRVARRFAGPAPAGLASLSATVWSVPNYPAAMPTWYNLFLALVALWSLFRFLDTQRRAWLVAAGAACGVSIAVKVVGLYTLAAVLLGLALVQSELRGKRTDRSPGVRTGYSVAVIGGTLAYLALVVALVRTSLDLATFVHFVLPSAAFVGLIAWRVITPIESKDSSDSFRGLLALVLPTLGGAVIPVVLFLLPYAFTGSLDDFFAGAISLPLRRSSLAATSASPLPLARFIPSLVPLALAWIAARAGKHVRAPALTLLALVLGAVLVLGGRDAVYRGVWGGVLLVPVLLTVGAAIGIARAWRSGQLGRLPLEAALVGLVLATFTLVQYPYSGPIYFYYLAPVATLGAVATLALMGAAWRAPALLLALFAALFGARWVGTSDLFATAQGRYRERAPVERLEIDRGGIRVSADERAEYDELAAMLRELGSSTGVMFATPDAPEAYFLSGLRNPTPIFYDFLDDPVGRTNRILAVLEQEGVRVIALNRAAQLSGPPAPDLVAALESRYPRGANVGRFVVRWR